MFDFTLSSESPIAGGMYINGQWLTRTPASAALEVENPANEDIIATIADGSETDALEALDAARRAFSAWAGRPAIERGRLIAALADEVQAHKAELARLVTLEQGKPLAHANQEIDAGITFLRYAAENARRIEGDIVASDNRDEEIHIRRHPYGVVVGLTAWNYPFALAARKLGPALVAGNTFVLLSHEATPLSGLALARLSERAGLPAGIFNVVTGRGPVVGAALVQSPMSDLVTMTGSTRAGREIYRAGADNIKVVRLELGGKAPFLVMEDADIDSAVQAAVAARYTNCGQICTCNERMYLHRAVADEFLEKFVAASKALTLGDPLGSVDMGPKVSRIERDKVADIVAQAVRAGADIHLEGGIREDGPFRKGHWFAPTVLEASKNDNPAVQNEVFGPVATAVRVDDFDTAVRFANDTSFGLSAYLFTRDHKRLAQAPYRLKFGELYLNRSNGEAVQGFHTGWGLSGLGGEDGRYGFDGYLRKQTAYLNWG
ncbi:aldehyde dehydrogenase family protein [Roseibium sp.]|uniref:aldehyde dehydrogenase family protein n=1 Tax=Roseibium sp. TaxID=1936156 RepID=UPI003BA9533A